MAEERFIALDAERLAGRRFPYQEDVSLVEDVDLDAPTPGQGLNWLEDVGLTEGEGRQAAFHRYSNPLLNSHSPLPEGREHATPR